MTLNRAIATIIAVALLTMIALPARGQRRASLESGIDRSPGDLAISPNDQWIVTANQTSHSATLIQMPQGVVVDEVAIGRRPEYVIFHPDGKQILVSCSQSGEVHLLRIANGELQHSGKVVTGFDPQGIALSADGTTAYVALTSADQIAVLDLQRLQVSKRILVGRWPRYLALSKDNGWLAVGTSGDRGISIVDLKQGTLDRIERFVGLNIGHLAIASDGQSVWYPWVVYRQNPISVRNIQLGWVLATRIGRLPLDGLEPRTAMSLDPQGEAIADPHGIAETGDGQHLVVSAAGSHEILVYRIHDLPLKARGSTDHIPEELLQDEKRFARIAVGGRPMGLRVASDNRTAFVANYLLNQVQEIDVVSRQLVRQIPLGGSDPNSLVRRGETIFYNADYSLDQWYSCHTCHYQAGPNAVAMDTMNDDSRFTFKSVPDLHGVAETGPWMWHGHRDDLPESIKRSVTSTMLGDAPTDKDVEALRTFLTTLAPSPSPFVPGDAETRASVERGREIFDGSRGGCAVCHSGSRFTDGLNHDLDLAGDRDEHQEFNTPSLRGVHRRVILLHDGRARSLSELLRGPHSPAKTGMADELSEQELQDLIAYLKTL